MAPADPAALARAFTAAINAGDVDSALALWVEEPLLIGPQGDSIRGRAALERTLRELVEQGVRLETELRSVHVAGDLALVRGTLTLRAGTGAHAYEHASESTVVYARAAGAWRIAIDAPWGLPAP